MHCPALAVSLTVVSLTAQGWVDRTPANPLAGPGARVETALCWDDAHGYVLMFGGFSSTGAANDTWTWNGTSWTRRVTATSPSNGTNFLHRPSAMTFHSPTGEVLLVCQGATYVWTGSDWVPMGYVPTPQPGDIPFNIALGRDNARNQTIMFVGSWRGTGGSITVLPETLVWDGFAWSVRPVATPPFPLESPSLAFDAAAGRLLLCTTDAAGAQSWFWEWNGSNWLQRSYAPAPVTSGSLATDSTHNKVVMFDASLNPSPNHTWTFANGTSAQLGLSTEPARRFGAGMAFDPVRARVVLFGGCNAVQNGYPITQLADTWEFELGAGAAYSTFGSGCAGSRGIPSLAAQGTSLPRAGTTFSLQLGNLPFTGPVFVFLGLSNTVYGPTSLPLSLGFLGAPGCSVLCSGEALYAVTNVLGSAVWQFPVPNLPGTTFYNQAFAFDAPANALGLTTSNAGQATIGF